MKTTITLTLTALVILALSAYFYGQERRLDQEWMAGYVEYQRDTYLPKPETKRPDPRLKGKVSG